MVLLAHDVEALPRTADVRLVENIDFNDMFFPDPILKGLKQNGFKKPSPIQYKAIPLARCGIDLIVQSKSGTGKTLVFALSTLEIIDTSINRVQAIVLTPTREIAVQVAGVYSSIGCCMKDLCVGTFIGGTPTASDAPTAAKCHVAIGAPGRVKHLVETGLLNLDAVRLFVLDEADQLMGKSFQPDINFIYWKLKENKQMIAASATYTPELTSFLSAYMRMPKLVTPDTDPLPVLRGLTQFAYITERHADQLARIQLKQTALLEILSHVKFNQCVIFSNYQSRGESAYGRLKEAGWAARWVCGGREQSERQAAVDAWTSGRVRVLVSTDLTARGIDSREADLVINLDPPWDPAIYLHRMGRAARYGTYGIVITVLSDGHDVIGFRKMLGQIGGDSLYVSQLPNNLDGVDVWNCADKLKKIYGIPKKVDESQPEAACSLYVLSAAASENIPERLQPANTRRPQLKTEVEFVPEESDFPSLGSDTSNNPSTSDVPRKLSYSDMVKEKPEIYSGKNSTKYESESSSSNDTSQPSEDQKPSYSSVVKDKWEVPRKRSYKECADDVKEPKCQPKFAEIIKNLHKSESSKVLTKDDLNDFFTQPDVFEHISFADISKSFSSFVKNVEEKENVEGKICRPRQKSVSKEEVFEFRARPKEAEVNEHLHKKAKVLTENSTVNNVRKTLSSPKKEVRGRQRLHSDERNKDSSPSQHKSTKSTKEKTVSRRYDFTDTKNVIEVAQANSQQPPSHKLGKTNRPTQSKNTNTSQVNFNTSCTQTVNWPVVSQGSQSEAKESMNKQTQSAIPKKLVQKPRTFAPRVVSESDSSSSSASEGIYIVSQSYMNSSNAPARPSRRECQPRSTMNYSNWNHMFQTQLWHIQNYVYFSCNK